MRIAYLVNTFPMTSQTFIRREMEALEATGVEVHRYAVRRWPEPLVDPLDEADRARTSYLLSGNATGLARALLLQACTAPLSLIRGLGVLLRLVRNARGRIIPHVAYLLEAVCFLQQVRSARIDHVHAHFSSNAAALALLTRRMGGPSYSFTAHGPDEFVDAGRGSLDVKIANAAFVVAISEFCRAQLLRFAGTANGDKIHVARCGLRLGEFAPRPQPLGGNGNLVCVGRLCPQKGQTLLPSVAAKLRDEFPNMRVVLIGDGESRSAIEAGIERHQVGDMLELRGWRSNEEVRATIAGARALVLPSLAEGLPIVLLEALALERAVVTTAVAGIPELVDASCGWVVAPNNEDELAEALRALMRTNSELLDAMGRAGRARVERHHDVRDLALALRGLFATAIETRDALARTRSPYSTAQSA